MNQIHNPVKVVLRRKNVNQMIMFSVILKHLYLNDYAQFDNQIMWIYTFMSLIIFKI